MADSLKGMSAKDIVKVSKLAAAPTSSDEFSEAFAENPTLALAAKGIELSTAEAEKIKESLGKLGGSPGTVESTSIGVVIKKKF